MFKQINNDFCGKLNINSETYFDTFFYVLDDMVTLIPVTEKCKTLLVDLENNCVNKSYKWLYGIAQNGCSVAFYNPGGLNVSFSYPVNLQPAKFKAPIILQSSSPVKIDLRSFDEIEFRSGVVNLLQLPSKAIEECYSKKYLKFSSPSFYTKEFPVHVNGVSFKIIYTVSLTDMNIEFGKVPDLRQQISSALRFEFDEAQPIERFETYYKYALRLFQFCTGRSNLGFTVRLFKHTTTERQMILAKCVDGFSDYADQHLNYTHIIHFDDLNDKLPNIFQLLNEEKKQPSLLFLPKRNKDVGYIYHTNITDLCVALELEYNYENKDQIDNDQREAKKLATDLNNFINKSEYPIRVKNKAINLNNNSLQNMQPSITEKIISLYSKFEKQLNEITKAKLYDSNGIPTLYTDEEFKKRISKFVLLRHRSAHAGIVWNEGVEVYEHLQILVYFSILKRANYTSEESKLIISNLFGYKFLR